jgi:hypothetical protein
MPPRTDRHPEYRQHPTRRTDFARRSGRSRSTISEACAGPLAAACTPDGRIDAAHPAAVAWARERGIEPEQLLEETSRDMLREDRTLVRCPAATLTIQALAEMVGKGVEEVEAEMQTHCADAIIPATHVTAEQVAFFAGCDVDDVLAAVDAGELGPAVQRTGYFDLGHKVVIAFAARRPFLELDDGEVDAPDGYLSAAMIGTRINAAHPVCQIFLARCLGRVPTAAEIAGTR